MFAKGILNIIPDDTSKVSERLPESVYEHFRNHCPSVSGIGVRRTPDLPFSMTGVNQPISPHIPQPKKGMPEWGPGYLEALHECRGRALDAAKAMDMHHSTVYKARQKFPDFDKAYQEIKGIWDDIVLEELEARSLDEAMNKSVVERIFHQKARNPSKYRDKQQPLQVGGNLTLILGFTPPDPPMMRTSKSDKKPLMEITADVLEESTNKRGRKGSDILTDDDLDV